MNSKSQSKPVTPRLSLKKFSRSSSTSSSRGGKEGVSTCVGPNGFDFGKSKITSKNEVVKQGKEVEVKIESLKLGKDDQLKVVVMRTFFSLSFFLLLLKLNRLGNLLFLF